MVILCDDNVNTLEDNSSSAISRNKEIKEIFNNLIINFSLTQHNFLPTFFRNQVQSSIDHIFSNCSGKIINTKTHTPLISTKYNNDTIEIHIDKNSMKSDHAMVSCTYTDKAISIPQRFFQNKG